jgi:hypothetical protein
MLKQRGIYFAFNLTFAIMTAIQPYFTFANVRYFGIFTPVMRAGDTLIYHLLINNFYQRRLRKTDKWVFDGGFQTWLRTLENFSLFWKQLNRLSTVA